MRRGPLLVFAMVAVAVGLAALAVHLRVTPRPRPVLLITIDTLRADRVGAYGRTPSLTPNLDRLAARGVVYEQTWTVAPLTVPAHATLLTGLLPPAHGLRTNKPRDRIAARIDRDWATLAEAMHGAGCRTAAFVSADVLRKDRTGLDAGFDVYDEVQPAATGSTTASERRGADTVERALRWLAEDDGSPFFLWVHLFDPHHPYDAPPPFGAGSAHVADATGYEAEIAYADECAGRLLAAVAEQDAVIAVVADHGEGLGEHGEATHGFLLHEATLRVPLIVEAGDSIPPGSRVASPVSIRHVAPTLLALARVALPDGMPRRRLPLTAAAAEAAGPESLYAETFYAYDVCRWAQTFALRVGDWKVIDAGSEVRETDLARDPREDDVTAHGTPIAAEPPGSRPIPLVEALTRLRAVAAATPGSARPPATPATGMSYLGPAGTTGSVLPADLNRRLPSPYARVHDLPTVFQAQALAAAAPERALALLGPLALREPGNPEIQVARARALSALGRWTDVTATAQAGLEAGADDSRLVELGLHAAVRSAETGGDPAAGLRLGESARSRGVPATPASEGFEERLRSLRKPSERR